MESGEPEPPSDAAEIRRESGTIIRQLGGEWPSNLPFIEYFEPRSQTEALERMLAMYGMREIALGRSIEDMRQWFVTNRLVEVLSAAEKQILEKPDDQLTERERINLSWYVEAIWAFAWAGSLVPDIPIEVGVGDQLDRLLEEIQKSGTGLEGAFRLRDRREIYRKLDLYYLAHWYARDGGLNGYEIKPFDISVIMERRKVLEWLNDRGISDWDEISLDT